MLNLLCVQARRQGGGEQPGPGGTEPGQVPVAGEEPGRARPGPGPAVSAQDPRAGGLVPARTRWEALRPHLDEIGVGLAVAGGLEQLEAVFKEMCEHLCGKPRPGLLDMPGVTPDQVASFYASAAFFFRQ